MHKGLAVLIGATLLGCVGARAQDIITLPGSNPGTTASVYSVNPIVAVTSFTTGTGSFLAAGKPDGSKYYVIANNSTNTVTVVDGSFSNPKFIGSFSQQPTAAVLTPDGKHLAIAAGILEIIDTTTDDITPVQGVNASDVAVSLDGSMIFALGQNLSGSVLKAVDPNQNTVLNTLQIAGQAQGVAAGPNGLVYVSTQNQFIEINPASLTPTPSGTIQLNALPGKAVFTPDGLHAIAANFTPKTGSVALLFDLVGHRLLNSISSNGFLVTLDTLMVASNGTFFAYSTEMATLYQMTVSNNGGFGINSLNITGIVGSNISALALSDEVAGGAISTSKYLFLAPTNGTLYRVDLNTNQIGSQAPTPNPVGALSYVSPAPANVQSATLLTYGGNQTIPASGTSLPVVARVLDATGRPINGATVNFTTDNANAKLKATSAVTGANGFAETTFVAPSFSGTVHVTATTGGLTATYTFTIGASSGGGPTAQISIIAGQGQILTESINAGMGEGGSSLTVQITDTNGNPVSGATVLFTSASGGAAGFVNGGKATGVVGQESVVTGANGQASIFFQATGTVPQNTGYVQGQVTAKAANTNTAIFYITVVPLVGLGTPPTVRLLQPQVGTVLNGQAGTVAKAAFSVQAIAGTGPGIPNVSLRIVDPNNANATPSATCVDPTGAGVLTDSTGTATCDIAFGGTLGASQIAGSVGYYNTTHPVNVQITPGPPGKVNKIAGDSQSGKPGTQLPAALVVQVTDAFGNVLSGQPVTFTPSSGVTLSNVISTTDTSGRASAIATLGSTPGQQTVTVTAGGITNTFNLTVISPAANIAIVSGNLQTTLINTQFQSPLVVMVTDSQSNPVASASVSFTVTSGFATVPTPNDTTDATGTTSTTVQAGSSAGTISITATVAGTNVSVTFTLHATVVVPAAIQVASGNSQTALVNTVFPAPIVVKVTDNQGNPLQGVAVIFAAAGTTPHLGNATAPQSAATVTLGTPNATTDANGDASTSVTAGPTTGVVTITATTGAGLTATFTLTVIPPGPVIKSVVNGASFQPTGQQGGGISPGSIATINGTGIATGIQGAVTSAAIIGPLQTTLAGVTVSFNGTPAPIYSVSNISGNQQVTVQVPFEVTPGTASLTVSVNGASSTINVQIQTYSPGVFELAGPGHLAVLVRPDGSYVSQNNPAQLGETVTIFATGLGQTAPAITTNQLGVPGQNVTAPITLGVDGKGVHPVSATTFPGAVGVYAVAFVIPSDAATGTTQQLGLSVKDSSGKTIFSQNIFAPIQ